jgi:signal transduction histidine kinase
MQRLKELVDSRHSRWWILATVLVMLVVTELLVYEIDSLLSQQARAELLDEAVEARTVIQDEITEGIYITIGLDSFIVSQDGTVVMEDIAVWMSELFAITPHLRNIGLAPDNVIRAIFPLAGNESVLGLDYRSLEQQWPAIEAIMKSKEALLVGPVDLVQGGQGVIYRRPVFVADQYWGLVSTVMDFGSLQQGFDQYFRDRDVGYRLEQVQDNSATVIAGQTVPEHARLAEQTIVFPGGNEWHLTVYHEAAIWPQWLARLALLVFFILLGLFLGQREARRRYQLEAERRGADDKLRFISTVSHELRTPLTSIAGSLKLLHANAAGDLPEPATRMVDIAYRNAKRLESLINDVLDMTRLESKEFTLTLETQALEPVLEAAIENIQAFAQGYQSQIHLKLPAKGPSLARIDAQRLLQVIDNLLSNAIKFSEADTEVVIELSREQDDYCIRVIDQGPGIPETFRARLFQPFAQADNTDNRTQQAGTGLGLSIVKELVERMHGRITVDSALGQGSTFSLYLPADVSASGSVNQNTEPGSAA